MIICYILCSIFFIPLIYSSDTTLPKVNQTANNSLNAKDKWKNTTKLPLNSENGSILLDKAVLTSKDNITVNFLNLEEGFGKIKEKPVHARKGVDLLDDIDPKYNISVDLNTLDKDSNIVPDKPQIEFKKPANSTTTTTTTTFLNEHKKNNSIPKDSQEARIAEKKNKIPKKPNKTVYESLAASLDQGSVTVKTSPHTLILNQIPSPKRDASIGQNPGMITPIVITILVVPMFAVLGYMALRRGQEAWKNRHYKRMDFLLDGMYND